MKVLLRWPRWAACSALAARVAVADPNPASMPEVTPPPGARDTSADSAPPDESAPSVEPPPEAAPSETAPTDASAAESGTESSEALPGETPPGEPPPGEVSQTDGAGTEAVGPTEVPAPPEPARTELMAPPPTAPPVLLAAPTTEPARPRGPLGWSARTTRTVGWITFAVSAAAGVGLTAAGIAACSGQDLGCIQGQPLIWSGAAVGLSGIPVGLTLVVRGGQLSVGTQAAGTFAPGF
jgi:hypothetical protein